jgi:transcriptional regulator with XRE-family HTH domain
MPFRLAFGQNLKSLRATAGLTQETVAMRCFLRTDQVSSFECGGAPPSLELLLLLGETLGVSLGELTEGLVAPARAASLGRVRALIAERPASTTSALAKASGLPESYVFQLLRYLALRDADVRPRRGMADGCETR